MAVTKVNATTKEHGTMNEIIKSNQGNQNLVVRGEAQAIGDAANDDAGYEKLLKFKKGVYECDSEKVPLGTEYVAHCVGWTKAWIKFVNGTVPEGGRKLFRVAEGKRIPDREELDDLDPRSWGPGPNGQPSDPWVFQYILPFENKAGDLVLFVTSSMGGKRAVADLCKSYSRRVDRTGVSENPIIKLAGATMPTRMFGDVPRPMFEIIGWDGTREGVRNVIPPDTMRDEMSDEIPF